MSKSNPGKFFIGGLPQDATNEDLSEAFGGYGSITDCIAMRDESGKSRGFGYVTFEDPTSVDAVMEQYENHMIRGKWVEVKACVPKESYGPQWDDKKFFIGGLTSETTTDQIGAYFSSYGDVTDCIAMVDAEQKPRGFGYCTFASPDSLKAVMNDYDIHELGGKWVEVQRCEVKGSKGKGGKDKGKGKGKGFGGGFGGKGKGFGGGGYGKDGGKGKGGFGGGGKGFGGGGKGFGGGKDKGFGGGKGFGGKGKGKNPY